jgi:DNA-binding NtrC family response regulator
VHKLVASTYQLIISSAHLAEIDNFLLLQRAQALAAGVPLVITAATGEKVSARRVLEQGAFDLISTPLEQTQTVSTIRLALWDNKLNALIASQHNALESYRQHSTVYSDTRRGHAFRTILTSIEQSVAVHERTIRQLETSLKRLNDLAKIVKNQARALALERLDRLYGPPRELDMWPGWRRSRA